MYPKVHTCLTRHTVTATRQVMASHHLPSPKRNNLNQTQEHRILSHFPNVAYNVVAIAASLGGLRAVSKILSALPTDFPAAITVVQHLSPKYRSYMAQILNQHTPLQVKQAETGELLRPGIVYTCVPDKHLLVDSNGRLLLSDQAKINFVRPSGDKLLESVANTYKTRAIAVVLTGRNVDGAQGVLSIKEHGGTAIAQDKATSECFSMPKAAIDTGKVDFVLPLDAIASTLVSLLMTEKNVGAALYFVQSCAEIG